MSPESTNPTADVRSGSMSVRTRLIVESLHRAVGAALDRKRRLSQYAVVWRAGRVERVQAEELGHDINQPMPGS
jgi:hypothetical protein